MVVLYYYWALYLRLVCWDQVTYKPPQLEKCGWKKVLVKVKLATGNKFKKPNEKKIKRKEK